jgi:hypothetical protein
MKEVIYMKRLLKYKMILLIIALILFIINVGYLLWEIINAIQFINIQEGFIC